MGTTATRLSHRQILQVLAGLMLGMFLAALDQTIVTAAIRTIGDDLRGLSVQAWVTTAYLITATISTPLYGKLSDIYGRKRFFLAAITIFVIGSAACSFATSMYMLAGFRAVQGLGAGGLFSLALAIVGDLVPPRERAKYQGYFLAVFGASSVLGPVIGGFFAGADQILGIAGWRWVFLVNVPVGALALTVVARRLRIPHTRRDHRIDWWGAAAICICLGPLLTVAEQGRTWGWDSPRSIACYVVGVAGLILFVATEKVMGEDALIPLRLFRNPTFSLTASGGFVIGMGMFGGLALLPLYLQIVRGASPTESGLQLLPLTAGIMAGSLISGQAIARTGKYRLFPIMGAALMVGGLLLLHQLTTTTPYWQTGIHMAVFGLGLGFLLQPITLAVQNATAPSEIGVATASSTFFRQMGATAGTALFLSILFATVGDRIGDAMRSAPGFQQALADPAVSADPANKPVLDAVQSGGLGGTSLDDTSFLSQVTPALARPFQDGFSAATAHLFLIAAVILVAAFVLFLFLPQVPLRAAEPAAAREVEGPATSPAGSDAPAHAEAGAFHAAASATAGSPASGSSAVGPATDALSSGGTPAGQSPDDGADVPAAVPGRAAADFDEDTPPWDAHTNTAHSPRSRTASMAASSPARPRPAAPQPDVTASAPDANPATISQPNLPTPTSHPDFSDNPAAVVSGRIDGPGERPMDGATVTVTDFAGTQLAHAVTGPDGEYRLALASGGSFLLICAAEHHQPAAALITVASGEIRRILSLAGTGQVSGVVTDRAARPLANATLTLTDPQGAVVATTTAAADGHYALAGLDGTGYTLTATAPHAEPVARRLDPSGPSRTDFVLAVGGTLSGRVRAAGSGRPIPEASVLAVDSSGAVAAAATTNPDGTYELHDLPPGQYTIAASGHAPVATHLDLRGTDATHDITLGNPA